jgi:hypothetical protein
MVYIATKKKDIFFSIGFIFFFNFFFMFLGDDILQLFILNDLKANKYD